METPTATEVQTTVIEKKDGDVIVTGTASQIDERQGPPTIQQKDAEIKQEKKSFEAKNKGWRSAKEGLQFVSGTDSGVLAWLNPMICEQFGLKDVGYKKALRTWNFPPGLDDEKVHTVYLQSYHQIEGRYLLIDFFDSGTPTKSIMLIKAWLEKLGYRYTYIIGGDLPKVDDVDAHGKFMKLIFEDRLKPMDEKDKNYPKFKIPWTLKDAGLQ
jgi:hypothetical protein